MSNEPATDGLKRVIGTSTLAATVVNNTLGAGIYALPAVVAMQMGTAGIWGYLFCYFIFFAIVLCYVEVGTRVTTSGGSYAYVEAAFGHFPGFIVNAIFFFGWGILGDAAVMNILADSLSVLCPIFTQPVWRAVLFFVLIGGMVLINIRGAKLGAEVVMFLTIIKIVPLVLIILFGFSHVQAANLVISTPNIKSLGETALVLFFAVAGFETSFNLSGEIKNPSRTLPRGIIWGEVALLFVYILIQLLAQGVLGNHIQLYKDAPLAAVAQQIVGPAGATILIIAAIISCLGNTTGDVLASPRLLYAGAHNGLFPKYLGRVHKKYATPHWAIFTYCALIFIFCVSGGFKQLAVLASASLLLIYLAVVLAMIKLRLKKEPTTEKIVKVPGGLTVPIIAVVGIIWVLINLSSREIISMAIFLAVLGIIYFVMKKLRKVSV